MSNVMIELPKSNAIQVFTESGGIDPYLQKIRQEALSHAPDLSTKTSRSEIASIAMKVAKCKTYLEDSGKQLCDQERAKIDATLSAVMASRKRIKEELDNLRDEVRKPLTDWENAEAERKGRIESRIEAMKRLPEIGSDSTVIQKHLSRLESTHIDESFGEYTADAAIARTHAIRDGNARLETQIKIEHDLKELEEFRIKNAEQAQKDRDKEIAQQAAYMATQKAESMARIALDEANAVIEAQKEKGRFEAENKRIQDAAYDAKIADVEYRQRVIEESIQSFVDIGFSQDQASRITMLVVNGKIKNLTINF